jgi:hypothetical protein
MYQSFCLKDNALNMTNYLITCLVTEMLFIFVNVDVSLSFISTDTSFSHNNGMEGEVMGLRPIGCMCNLPIIKNYCKSPSISVSTILRDCVALLHGIANHFIYILITDFSSDQS